MWLGLGHLCESASECEESIPEFLFQYTLKGFLWDQSRAAKGIMSCRSTFFFLRRVCSFDWKILEGSIKKRYQEVYLLGVYRQPQKIIEFKEVEFKKVGCYNAQVLQQGYAFFKFCTAAKALQMC